MLVFEERRKPEYPEKNLSEQSREPTNSVHMWRRVRESNPGHIDGRRALSPLRQPCSFPPGAVRILAKTSQQREEELFLSFLTSFRPNFSLACLDLTKWFLICIPCKVGSSVTLRSEEKRVCDLRVWCFFFYFYFFLFSLLSAICLRQILL